MTPEKPSSALKIYFNFRPNLLNSNRSAHTLYDKPGVSPPHAVQEAQTYFSDPGVRI